MNRKRRTALLRVSEFITFTFPAVIVVSIVSLIPFVLNLYYALFDWNGISRNMKFIGVGNFVRIFTIDTGFWNAALFTSRFSVFYVILVNVLSVLFALLLARTGFITSVVRSCFYIPFLISLIVVSFVWKFLFGPGFEVLYKITSLSFLNLSWLGNSRLVFWSVLLVSIWQNTGFYMVIYIAGIVGIPKELIEASKIDGSRGLNRFFCITLPLIMPSVTICIFSSMTFAFKLFDIILVFTGGGPGTSSNTVAFNIYIQAFRNARYGMATAKSVLFFLAVMLVTVLQLVVFKNREVEA
jgi:raffinose/stachyose/melibiose transport system permease protein